MAGETRTQVELIIDAATGKIESLKPLGVVGPACRALTRGFEARYGGTKTDTDLPELHQAVVETQKATNKYGV